MRSMSYLAFYYVALLLFIVTTTGHIAHAQCEWLQYAPYYVKPTTPKYYEYECGFGNAVWITRCSTDKAISNLDNSSGCTVGAGDTNNYSYFPQTLKVNAGTTVDFFVSINYDVAIASPASVSALDIWIDWNHNGLYEQDQFYSEQVKITKVANSSYFRPEGNVVMSTTLANAGTPAAFTVEIPAWAKNGPTRMRIRSSAAGMGNLVYSHVGACGHSKYGEIEEYDVDIVNPCYSPKVISISDVSCNSAKICWSIIENADLYDYWVDTCRTPGCSIPLFNPGIKNYFDIKTQNCVNLPNSKYPLGSGQLLPEKKYYVLVRSICDTIRKPTSQYWQVSDWNVIDSFTTLPCCEAPQNVRMSSITSTSATATWDPVYTATKYEYAVMTTPAPPPPASGARTFNTYTALQGLTPAKTYYMCVRALCTPTPESNWTCVPFSTDNTLSIESPVLEPLVSIFPNPVKNMLTVKVGQADKNAMLTVSDVAGRTVYAVGMEAENLEVNMSGWNSGLYFVKYTSVLGNQVVKVIKD